MRCPFSLSRPTDGPSLGLPAPGRRIRARPGKAQPSFIGLNDDMQNSWHLLGSSAYRCSTILPLLISIFEKRCKYAMPNSEVDSSPSLTEARS